MLTPQQLSDYSADGYFLIEGMLSRRKWQPSGTTHATSFAETQPPGT